LRQLFVRTKEHCENISKSLKKYYEDHDGNFLGKSHPKSFSEKIILSNSTRLISEETKRKISNSLKGKLIGKNHPNFGKSPRFYKSFYFDGIPHILRSGLERDFFLFLIRKGILYKYEPKRFQIKLSNTVRNYWPDAQLIGTNIFIECKGWCDPYSVLKMSEFRKQYPENKLFVVIAKQPEKIPIECYDKLFVVGDLEFDWKID
jgi:hypothetical protein